jgi:hypothetical protein
VQKKNKRALHAVASHLLLFVCGSTSACGASFSVNEYKFVFLFFTLCERKKLQTNGSIMILRRSSSHSLPRVLFVPHEAAGCNLWTINDKTGNRKKKKQTMLLPSDPPVGGRENRADKCEPGCFCYRWPLAEGRTASKRVSIRHLEQTSCNEPKLYQICDRTKS